MENYDEWFYNLDPEITNGVDLNMYYSALDDIKKVDNENFISIANREWYLKKTFLQAFLRYLK